ncbi:cytochrome c [Thermoproteus uzoniensis 768-20]|uniref:Cytochrome c n=1 Tax=Thermoproteus uzoniensis (strain 768-20) TaxID=999630 RepID=F2L6F5_THEU7|nr:hypothetical protein [Thermoproteus uzoniensis]AEA12551.1 cytochrome c [Thermoproteus uzoniensis 768-20]
MKTPTLVLIGGIVVIVIATGVALSLLSSVPSTTSPTSPAPPPQTATSSSVPSSTSAQLVPYNATLASIGIKYFKTIGCVFCHSIQSLGIQGGNVGPDLSKALLGNPGVPGDVLTQYFQQNGLTNPAADPQKAAQLIEQFLQNPPSYAGIMQAQVSAFKQQYANWTDIVKAIVEMLKEAADKATSS